MAYFLTITFRDQNTTPVSLIPLYDTVFLHKDYEVYRIFSKYTIIPERTLRGAWHFHGIVEIKDQYKFGRYCGYLKDECGYIKVRKIKDSKKVTEYINKQLLVNEVFTKLPRHFLIINNENYNNKKKMQYLFFRMYSILIHDTSEPTVLSNDSAINDLYSRRYQKCVREAEKERLAQIARDIEIRNQGIMNTLTRKHEKVHSKFVLCFS